MNLCRPAVNWAARKLDPVAFGTILLLAAPARMPGADVTFSPGAYIIDMGQPVQTPANGLKPYGLIYHLVVDQQVPVDWSINPNKITDKNSEVTVEGTDFTVGGKAYRGGPFIIPAVFVNAAVSNVIATWRAKGVVVDGPISRSFTAPIYNYISSFPTALLDVNSGNELVTAFYEPAEIPAVTYHFGGPRNLDICDDLYGMPENEPHKWDAATRAQFLAFILHGGSLWTSCRTVSSLEAPRPTYCGFNFLSATSLIPAAKHYNNNRVPLRLQYQCCVHLG